MTLDIVFSLLNNAADNFLFRVIDLFRSRNIGWRKAFVWYLCEYVNECVNERTKKRMSEWMFHSIAIKRDCPTLLECYLMTQYMSQSMKHTSYATFFGGVPRNIATSFFILECVYQETDTRDACHITHAIGEGREGGVLIPFPRKLLFSNPSSNPTIPACVAQIEIPFPFFYSFFINPSPSAQNLISQPLKKANPSSQFTPSRPS